MPGQRFSTVMKKAPGAKRVPLGDLGDSIWSEFTATVSYEDDGLIATLRVTFDGDRIDVRSITVERSDGGSVSASDMTKLVIGEVVHEVAGAAVTPGHGAHLGRRHGRSPTPEELRLLAAVYWFEHATRGNPRRAVMGYWGIPRATANRWIRKARELHELPGGADEEE